MSENISDIRFSELKDVISQLNTTVQNLNDTIAMQTEQMALKDATIAKLTEEVAYLKKKLFGSSSEKRSYENPDQMTLFDLLGIKAPEPEPVAETVVIKEHTRKKKPDLATQFKDIETEVIEVDSLSDEEKKCPECGTEMVRIGTEPLRTEIEYTPAKFRRIQYVSVTYECPECKETEHPHFMKDKGAPPALISGSYLSESLATEVIKEKFALGLPAYRIEKNFASMGAPITRASICSWIMELHNRYLYYMTDFFHRQILKRMFVMMDETTTQVLKEEGRRPQSKSYVWLLRTGEDGLPPIVSYFYRPTRAGTNAADILDGAPPGIYIMADGYKGYNRLKEVRRCCCFSHIRRYFFDAIPNGKEKDMTVPAVQAVTYCDRLFEYERKYKAAGLTPEERYKCRLKDEKPIVEAFMAWLDIQKVSSTSAKFNTAMTYANNNRKYMMTYLEDGRCSLSNNPSENSIRPVVMGRKAWLFNDTPEGAEACMGMYTSVENAKLHGLNIEKYISFLLHARPSGDMTDEELEKLAPWNEDVKKACCTGYGKKVE